MLDDYLSRVLLICAEEFGVKVEDVISSSKSQELVYCRKAFCITVKELLDVKLTTIANKIGRSKNAVSVFITNQPENKYYNACLKRIKSRVQPFE